MEYVFRVMLTDEAVDFLSSMPVQARDKMNGNISRAAKGERNTEIFKKLQNSEIWEFRAEHRRISYRLFSFWDSDEETLVIATHGIVKKTQKTPSKEIAKAEAIRKKYFNNNHFLHIEESIQKFLACSIDKAFIVYQCPLCGGAHKFKISCKSRLCPACSKKYAALWADKTAASLINTKHRAVLKRKLKSLLLLFIKKYEIFLIIKLPSITKIFLIIRKKLKLLWT